MKRNVIPFLVWGVLRSVTMTDEDDGGTSTFYWPEGLDKYGSFETYSRDHLGYVSGSIRFGNGYEFPYGRIGFHIKGSGSSTDITAWGGMCIVYTATQEFYLRIQADEDEESYGYGDYQAKIPAAKSMSLVNVPWADFIQEGLKKGVSQAHVLSSAQKILFDFKGDAETSNVFTIHAIGKYGTCNNVYWTKSFISRRISALTLLRSLLVRIGISSLISSTGLSHHLNFNRSSVRSLSKR